MRPDAQPFDEIRISTVPRYKMSGLSGNEWRISAKVEFFRKGALCYEQFFRNIESAVMGLGGAWQTAHDSGKGFYASEDGLCDQEGCSNRATVKYARKQWFCNDGHPHEFIHGGEEFRYRQFCEAHKTRGDGGLDDADRNYAPVDQQLGETGTNLQPPRSER